MPRVELCVSQLTRLCTNDVMHCLDVKEISHIGKSNVVLMRAPIFSKKHKGKFALS